MKVAGDGDEGPSVCVASHSFGMNDVRSCFCLPGQRVSQVLQVLENVELFAFVRLFPILSRRYISEGKYLNQTKQKIFSVDLGKANGRYIYSKKCCSFVQQNVIQQ